MKPTLETEAMGLDAIEIVGSSVTFNFDQPLDSDLIKARIDKVGPTKYMKFFERVILDPEMLFSQIKYFEDTVFKMTKKQVKALQAMCDYSCNKMKAAKKLGLNFRTIEMHLQRIRTKHNIKTTAECIDIAVKMNIIKRK